MDSNIEKFRSLIINNTNEYCPIIETHAHYNLDSFKNYADALLLLMHNSNRMSKCIIPAIRFNDISKTIEKFSRYDWIFYSVGLHPKYIYKEQFKLDEEKMSELQDICHSSSRVIAIGETGLDYCYKEFCEKHRELQLDAFQKFIDLSNKEGLPVILHIRASEGSCENGFDTHKDAIALLTENKIKHGAVAHCYDGCYLDEYLRVGVEYFGIGGRISYNEDKLKVAVANMPEDAILLETDAPFMRLPSNMPGTPNTSLALMEIASIVADIRNTTTEHIIEVANRNAERLFNI